MEPSLAGKRTSGAIAPTASVDDAPDAPSLAREYSTSDNSAPATTTTSATIQRCATDFERFGTTPTYPNYDTVCDIATPEF